MAERDGEKEIGVPLALSDIEALEKMSATLDVSRRRFARILLLYGMRNADEAMRQATETAMREAGVKGD